MPISPRDLWALLAQPSQDYIIRLNETFPFGSAGAGRTDLHNYVGNGGWTWKMGQELIGYTIYEGESFVAASPNGAIRDGWSSVDSDGFGALFGNPPSRVCADDVEYIYELDLDIPQGSGSYIQFSTILERRKSTVGDDFFDHESSYNFSLWLFADGSATINSAAVRLYTWNADIQDYTTDIFPVEDVVIPPGYLYGGHTLRFEKRSTTITVKWNTTVLGVFSVLANGAALGAGTVDGFSTGTGGKFGFGWRDEYTDGAAFPLTKCTGVRLIEYPSGIPV